MKLCNTLINNNKNMNKVKKMFFLIRMTPTVNLKDPQLILTIH